MSSTFEERPCENTRRRQLIHGVGLNDAPYQTMYTENGKPRMCPYYRRWVQMYKRCYSAKFHARNPSYVGSRVDAEWHVFTRFKAWMQSQDWHDKQLNRDLLVPGNKVYAPDKCVFIPYIVARVFYDPMPNRSGLPKGVCFDKSCKRYKAHVSAFGRKHNHLGYFDTVCDARAAYLKVKREYIEYLANSHCGHDARLANALRSHPIL